MKISRWLLGRKKRHFRRISKKLYKKRGKYLEFEEFLRIRNKLYLYSLEDYFSAVNNFISKIPRG